MTRRIYGKVIRGSSDSIKLSAEREKKLSVNDLWDDMNCLIGMYQSLLNISRV